LWVLASPSDAATAKKKPAATKKSATAKKAPARKKVVSSKPKPKVAAKPRKKVVVLPKRPPADLPAITEAASAWQGCASSADVPALADQVGIEETRLETLLQQADLLTQQPASCTQYVAVKGGLDDVALLMFHPDDASPVLTVHKTPYEVTVNTTKCDCDVPSSRVVTLPLPATEALAELPPQIKWIAETLLPSMAAGLQSDGPSNLSVRLVIADASDVEPEHLRSIELLESTSGKRIDGAWWLERPNGPGVLMGMNGLAYEQLLWQSPVAYEHMSRGVGPRMKTVKRKEKDGTISTRRVLASRTYHYGVDMMARKGTDVHAVADATVAFAGRKTGFGNIVILDHGHGYQTYYAHLSKIMPEMKHGAVVPRGELIGLVGSTGRSTAPHLHFEMRQNNNYIDPFDEGHQLDFWPLSSDDQERLAMQILAPSSKLPLLLAAEEE
jgi:murein DD-endopeptidase MepM/ murein hydrolase activator NlpD